MINLNFIKKNQIDILFLLSIFILGSLLRYYYYFNLDGWFDEWNMIYTVDPDVSNEKTWERYFGDRGDHDLPEYYPPLNAFFLKYVSAIFGYYIENLRSISLVFGSGSIILTFILAKNLTEVKYSMIATILVALNLFLIWQSSEIRPHSFVIFFSLLNISLFLKIINKSFTQNKLLYVCYILVSILLLSSWPFTIIIFFSKFVFLFQRYLLKKTINKSLIVSLIFSCFLYIILNADYLIYHLARDEHYTKLYLSFFYSFHFRSFFGSIFLGGIFLMLFAFLLIKNLVRIFSESNNNNFIILIILSSYFLTILYSLIGASVISPKYIIFILPLIIIWITTEIGRSDLKSKNLLLILLIIISVFNLFLNFNNNPIDRPPTKQILNIIKSSKLKTIYTNETAVFNNFIGSHKIFVKEELKIDKITNVFDFEEKFWFLCLNNPRYAVGDNNFPDEEKCNFLNSNDNLILIEELRLTDYLLRSYEKKN